MNKILVTILLSAQNRFRLKNFLLKLLYFALIFKKFMTMLTHTKKIYIYFSDDKNVLDSYAVTIDREIISPHDDSFNSSVLLEREKKIQKEKRKMKKSSKNISCNENEKIINQKPVFDSDSSDKENQKKGDENSSVGNLDDEEKASDVRSMNERVVE